MAGILEEIAREVEAAGPRIVVVDSFRTVVRKASESDMEIQLFVQNPGLLRTSREATTFMLRMMKLRGPDVGSG